MALSVGGRTSIVRIARLETKGKKCKDSTTTIALGGREEKSFSSRMMIRLDEVHRVLKKDQSENTCTASATMRLPGTRLDTAASAKENTVQVVENERPCTRTRLRIS